MQSGLRASANNNNSLNHRKDFVFSEKMLFQNFGTDYAGLLLRVAFMAESRLTYFN